MEYLEKTVRPWGRYEKFYQEDGVWVKRVEVAGGKRLSLQHHKHRSEKWVFVHGQGVATVNKQEIPVGPGSVVDIPLGAVHRIANPNDKPLVFIEVACGDYLAEDDIVRLEDDYARK
jgi:mannose-6-phosphate isomerase-like protein (cupin superfamily)